MSFKMLFVWINMLNPPKERNSNEKASLKKTEVKWRFSKFRPLVISNKPVMNVLQRIEGMGKIDERTKNIVMVPKILRRIFILFSIEIPKLKVEEKAVIVLLSVFK